MTCVVRHRTVNAVLIRERFGASTSLTQNIAWRLHFFHSIIEKKCLMKSVFFCVYLALTGIVTYKLSWNQSAVLVYAGSDTICKWSYWDLWHATPFMTTKKDSIRRELQTECILDRIDEYTWGFKTYLCRRMQICHTSIPQENKTMSHHTVIFFTKWNDDI